MQTKTQSWALADRYGKQWVFFNDRGDRMALRFCFMNYLGHFRPTGSAWLTREAARAEWKRLKAAGYNLVPF